MENTVEITMERYEQLMEAEVKLKVLKEILEKENRPVGYDTNTSDVIDTILGIKRDEK